MAAKVLIVMGSTNDLGSVEPAWQVLDELGIGYEVRVASAHRTPDIVHDLASKARTDGFAVIIAAAGIAAHLAGVCASLTTLPVIALPISSGTLGGVDALLSSVQMPPGVPIASVGINAAKNAGLYAAAMIAIGDGTVAKRLDDHRQAMRITVMEADERLRKRFDQDHRDNSEG